MRFQDYLQEKLQPSQFRDIVKLWKEAGVRQKFDHVFDKKDRIYEPYDGDTVAVEGNNVYKDIRKALRGEEYELQDYAKGLLFNPKTKKQIKFIKWVDGKIKHYKEYKLPDIKDEDKMRRSRQAVQNVIDKYEQLKKDFINDKTRAGTKGKLLICYSRHAYDIAGMSTDRGWTSCMALPGDKEKPHGGVNSDYVPVEIQAGTIIAYLIKEDDKNLQHPLGRMLIKPYFNDYHDDIYMVACTGGYGTVPDAMKRQVSKWAESLNKLIKPGFYKLSRDLESSNTGDTFKIKEFRDNPEDLKKNFPDLEIITNLKDLIPYFRQFIFSDVYQKHQDSWAVSLSHKGNILFDMKKIADSFNIDDMITLYRKSSYSAEQVRQKILRFSVVRESSKYIDMCVLTDLLSAVNKTDEDDDMPGNTLTDMKQWLDDYDLKFHLEERYPGNKLNQWFALFKKYYPKMRKVLVKATK
jgi:hypothetical protein